MNPDSMTNLQKSLYSSLVKRNWFAGAMVGCCVMYLFAYLKYRFLMYRYPDMLYVASSVIVESGVTPPPSRTIRFSFSVLNSFVKLSGIMRVVPFCRFA